MPKRPERWIRDFAKRLSLRKDGCLIWTGPRDPDGYAVLRTPDWLEAKIGQDTRKVGHRMVWRLCYGPIPEGKIVCHLCGKQPCLNPSHLYLGTPEQNIEDKSRHALAKVFKVSTLAVRRGTLVGDLISRMLAEPEGLDRLLLAAGQKSIR